MNKNKEFKVYMKTVNLFGIKMALGKKSELVRLASKLVGVGGVIFTPNLQILAVADKNSEYKKILNTSSLNIPDSVGVKYLLAVGGEKTDVLPGVELGEALVFGHSFAIIGGRAGRAERAGQNLCKKHRGARFLFSFSGYGYDEQQIKEKLRLCKPDICIVCLGVLKQELFIERVRSASPKTLYLALGGSVDVYSGFVKRAPTAFRHLGLEWLYRALREPKRIRRLPRQLAFFLREFFTVLNKKERCLASKISK